MYPAGRILHLVPAFLVFTEEELQKLGEAHCLHICSVLLQDGYWVFGYTWHFIMVMKHGRKGLKQKFHAFALADAVSGTRMFSLDRIKC